MFFVLMIAMFIAGYVSKKPEIETQTKIEKVYGLPEGITLQQVCDSFYEQEISDIKAKAQVDIERWKQNYMQGYLDRGAQ